MTAPKRIALLLGQDLGYCRGVMSGILSYAETHELNWVYHDAPTDVRVLNPLRSWQPDGVIAHLFDRELAEQLQQLNIPIISTTNTLRGLSTPSVDVDNEAVGNEAACYFLNRGYRSFGYFGSQQTVFSRARKKGFANALTQAGYALSSCHANFLPRSPFAQDWSFVDAIAEKWLKSLTFPAAVLASNDIPARALCEICRQTGIRVPQDIAILGVDNDNSECRLSSPSLSSIDIPSQPIGRRAAEMLNQIFNKVSDIQLHVTLPPRGIITRDSTDPQATLDEPVRKALHFIEENSNNSQLNVETVCTSAKMSRRSLERLFERSLKISIYQQIQNTRIERAKRLLLESELTIAEIADRAGLSNLRKLERVFLKATGCSPTDFRVRH